MAQNIDLLGVEYSAVPSVLLPKHGGGIAQFDDTTISSNAASASDIANGKLAYVNNSLVTGTFIPKLVQGEFKTGSSAGTKNVNVDYNGNGYPIALVVVIKGGAYNSSNTAWYDLVQRYAVGYLVIVKSEMTTTPTYTTSGTNNGGTVCAIYKNSTSDSTSYSRNSYMGTNLYTSYDASNQWSTCVRWKSNKQFQVYQNSSNYCLPFNMDFQYFVAYSS